jgi:hypothetical protein
VPFEGSVKSTMLPGDPVRAQPERFDRVGTEGSNVQDLFIEPSIQQPVKTFQPGWTESFRDTRRDYSCRNQRLARLTIHGTRHGPPALRSTPTQSSVDADIGGDIGFPNPDRVPVRKSGDDPALLNGASGASTGPRRFRSNDGRFCTARNGFRLALFQS